MNCDILNRHFSKSEIGNGFKLFVLLYVLSQIECRESPESLELVHVIFRHGDRNPDLANLYPQSPYYNESYYAPLGYGQLTNKGKLRSYELGVALRERYNGFLDQAYNINLIQPRSSDFGRTKESLQAMLAGLFPPTPELVWLEGLKWQPIAINYEKRKYDKELLGYICPQWNKEMDSYLKSKEGRAIANKYQDTFKYISESSGDQMIDILRIYYLNFGFMIQEELNLTLPKWTKEVYPEPMNTIALELYNLMFATPSLKKMSIGYLLKTIYSDTMKKITGALPRRKIYLYSGHDHNVAAFLKISNCIDDEIPDYSTYILLELHNINNTYGFKLFYQNYSTAEPKSLRLPNCGEFCPFEKFVSITELYLPEDESICGTDSASNSFKLIPWPIYLVIVSLYTVINN